MTSTYRSILTRHAVSRVIFNSRAVSSDIAMTIVFLPQSVCASHTKRIDIRTKNYNLQLISLSTKTFRHIVGTANIFF